MRARVRTVPIFPIVRNRLVLLTTMAVTAGFVGFSFSIAAAAAPQLTSTVDVWLRVAEDTFYEDDGPAQLRVYIEGAGPDATGTLKFSNDSTGCFYPGTTLGTVAITGYGPHTSVVVISTVGRRNIGIKYSGDANYTKAEKCVQVTLKTSPSLQLALTPAHVTYSQRVNQDLSLTGLTNEASGTVTVAHFGTGNCTGSVIESHNYQVNGGQLVTTHDFSQPPPGDFSARATYSGDAFNGEADSSCVEYGVVATIDGVVFVDHNGDSEMDPGEPGTGGATVRLRQAGKVVATAVTGADGKFAFTVAKPVVYEVTAAAPAGFALKNPQYGSSFTVDLRVCCRFVGPFEFAVVSSGPGPAGPPATDAPAAGPSSPEPTTTTQDGQLLPPAPAASDVAPERARRWPLAASAVALLILAASAAALLWRRYRLAKGR